MVSYTVKEIDELRDLCRTKYLFGWYNFPENWEGGSSRVYTESEMNKAVEEMVRTFILAGKKPEDFYD